MQQVAINREHERVVPSCVATSSAATANLTHEPTVAVLFARRDSNYKELPSVGVWDADRDARNFPGGCPVVAHPPCRAWGSLRNKANPRPDEKQLALWAVEQVRRWGGVLEHPERSTLWEAAGLPGVGGFDQWGGFTIKVDQHWWGHRARKRTLLYICGITRREVPRVPLTLTEPTHVVSSGYAPHRGHRHRSAKPEISKAEREHTPPEFAAWLVELAGRCRPNERA